MKSWAKMWLAMIPLAGLSACSADSRPDDTEPSDLVAQEHQNARFFSAIVRLKSPALLASADQVNGQLVISPSARATVDAEHKAFIDDLKGRSSEVRILFEYRLVLNAVSVLAPKSLRSYIEGLPGIGSVEAQTTVRRPRAIDQGRVFQPDSFS